MYSFLSWFSQILLLLLGFFLIVVVLLQRGRGGGLAGAFGGTGGQSAFGTKAGDVFTKITIVIAILWVVVSGASGFAMRAAANQKASQFPDTSVTTEMKDPPVPTATSGSPPESPQPPAGKQAEQPAEGATTTPATDSGAAAPTGGAEPAATSTEPATSTPPASEGGGDAPSPN